jgi:alpha-tubulin suppressor-like RCC1 family protein
MLTQVFKRNVRSLIVTAYLVAATPTLAVAVTPQIKAAGDHAVVLKGDGTVWQWGAVAYGRKNSPSCSNITTVSNTPVQVKGLGTVQAIATGGGAVNIALVSDGTVWGWGLDPKIVCGASSGADVQPYLAVWQIKDPLDPGGFLKNVSAIRAGSGSYFARKSDGTVWAWGNNNINKLGVNVPGKATSTKNPPADVETIATPMKVGHAVSYPKVIASGSSHTLVTSYNNTGIRAWGGDGYGQRGDGSYNHSDFPYWNGHVWYDQATSTMIDGVTDIAAGDFNSMAIKSDGTVWAWGRNNSGELGGGIMPWGEFTDGSNTPVQIAGISGASAIALAPNHSVVMLANGTIWALGFNGFGRLGVGDPTIGHSTTPLQVTGLTGVTAVDASGARSVALKNDGTVWEWGKCNDTPVFSPVQVNFNGPAISVATCGNADGLSFGTVPTKNLCLVGTPTQVTGSGPWTWKCVMSNGSTALCSANTGPFIITNPADVKKLQGLTATLSVIAQGNGQLQYQWYKDGSPVNDGHYLVRDKYDPLKPTSQKLVPHVITGATTAQLKIVNLRAADSGAYYVVVKDQTGAAISKTAKVSVMVPTPSIPKFPVSR